MTTTPLKHVVLAAAVLAAAPVFGQSTIKVGVQAPITGEYAAEGQGMENAARLIVAQVNAGGGAAGRKLEIVTCDDEGKPAQAAICARKLVNAGVNAVVGSYTSGATLAAVPIYTAANVIVTSDASSDDLTQRGYKTFFRNAPPNNAEALFTAEYLVGHKKYKRIAVLSDHSAFASGLGAGVVKAVKAAGGNILSAAAINAGSQDFTPVLTRIKSENADVVYFSGYYSDGALIRAQMVQLGLKAHFVGGDANQNTVFAKIAGAAAKGAIIIGTPDPENMPYPLAREFVAKYKEAYKAAPPSIYSFTNADGLRAVVAAINATQSVEPGKLIGWLHQLKDFDGITGRFSFDAKGERLGSPFVAAEINAAGAYDIVYPPQKN